VLNAFAQQKNSSNERVFSEELAVKKYAAI